MKHLRCVRGRYDFRRRVPLDLRAALGITEVTRTLGSVPFAEALVRARRLSVETDGLFEMVRAKLRDLTDDDAVRIAREWFFDKLTQGEALHAATTKTPAEVAARVERNKPVTARFAAELAAGDTSNVMDTARKLLDENGMKVAPGSQEERRFQHLLLRGLVAVAQSLEARAAGDYGFSPADPVFADAVPGKRGKPRPRFSEAWATYAQEKTRKRSWRAEMERGASDSMELFREYLGDQPVNRYSRQELSRFAQALQALPKLRGKSPSFDGKSIAEMVELTRADPKLVTLSPRTVSKHMNNISSFFSWAADQGHVESNVAKGVYKKPKSDRAQWEERAPWSPDQLRKLFSSPLYRGCQSRGRRAAPGALVLKDARYWLPLLGLFHPVRLEEMAQLRTTDIREEGAVWFFDLREGDGRKLKTHAARRRIPVHRVLLDLGFLDYLRQTEQSGKEMLFPELEPGGSGERYGYAFTKWFCRYRDQLGIKDVQFHGFRHSSITALGQAGVSNEVIHRLDGHELPGQRGRYDKGPGLPALKEAVDKIEYPGITADFIGQKRQS